MAGEQLNRFPATMFTQSRGPIQESDLNRWAEKPTEIDAVDTMRLLNWVCNHWRDANAYPAAPSLLAACKALKKWCDMCGRADVAWPGTLNEAIMAAEAAVAKAGA